MDRVAEYFINFVNTPWAPVVLFIHAFMEASFLPGAHDFFLVAVDVIRPDLCFYFAAFSTLGSTAGGCFGYGLGRFLGRPVLTALARKKKTIDAVERSYQKYGMWAVAFAGFTPVPYKVFSVASGVFMINFPQFVIVSFFARGARFFLVSGLIFFIGTQIKDHVIHYFNIFSLIFLGLMMVFCFLLNHIIKKLHHE